ncbi:NAD(P)-binding protein [Hymenopellis radicata]|nr:NAD(P)-binding protein [Hymenopellis radicata]
MSPTTKVLILGATGYIGGSVLLRALERPGLKVTALVRSADKAQKLKTLIHDVNVVEGTLTDASLLKELIKDTDVIIDTYSSDDMVGTANLLAGCKAKYQVTGKKTEVIHVSGAALIADDARGMDVPSKVYDDANVEEMANIPEAALHRNVDLEFLKAETEGYITVYLVIPAAVFGDVSNALVDAGIQKDNAAVFTLSIRPVFTFKGDVATIGEGLNRWSIVHIDDLTDLMMIIFDKVLKKEHVPHGKEGYYFAENGEIFAHRVAAIAAQTYKTVRGEDAQKIEKRPLTKAELDMFFPGEMAVYIVALSANSRCVGTRGRKLGWAPTRGVEALEKWVKETSRAITLSQ